MLPVRAFAEVPESKSLTLRARLSHSASGKAGIEVSISIDGSMSTHDLQPL